VDPRGVVDSNTYDHTSVLRFLEAWTGVAAAGITPWRRSVTGDLTAAFDFARPDFSVPALPDTVPLLARSRSRGPGGTGRPARCRTPTWSSTGFVRSFAGEVVPAGTATVAWPVDADGYYDVIITADTADTAGGFTRRYAGRVA
jgi:hypothetical protein